MTILLLSVMLYTVPDSLLEAQTYWHSLDKMEYVDESDVEMLLNIGVFHRINAFRIANGINALVWSDKLSNAAKVHNLEMDNHQFFAHSNPRNRSLENVTDRLQHVNASYTTYGENIAYFNEPIEPDQTITAKDIPTWSEALFSQWKNSKGHRINMLRTIFTQSGISCYLSIRGKKKKQVVVYATNVFTDKQ